MDIIIPIYNAYDDLVLCINSIVKCTDLKRNRLILINDNSTDQRIKEYLDELKNENVLVIHNERNRGFSNNVNLGMRQSESDVILLNSDTIVTTNWVEKIIKCAYSYKEIGTVTPLSNSATLCSVPVFCQDNLLPTGVTIEEYADIIERCSMHLYPRITVAVGFCMFIKREVISCIGYFDAVAFERGYGEENDFCNRAEQNGYIHVMCDDTFIYHKGTGSFQSREKKELIERHNEILLKRYRKQMEKNTEYCIRNPHQFIRDNIDIYLSINRSKKNILYLIQSDFKEGAYDNIGGTQLHVKDLTLGLKDSYNIFVLARNKERMNLTIYLLDKEISFSFYLGETPDFPLFYDHRQKEIYSKILDAFSIDIVHIHHTLNLSLDLYYESFNRNIPVLTTLHDYYYICPSIKLLNNKNKLCIGCDNRLMCSDCLHSSLEIADTVDFLSKWRRECLKALMLCEKLIVPSESAKSIFIQYYSVLENKLTVVEHGIKKVKNEINDYIFNKKIKISPKFKSFIENIKSDNDMWISIWGWAYMDGLDSKDSNIYLEVTDEKENVKIIKTNKLHRLDVAGENDNNLYSGFSSDICKNELEPGLLKIRLVIENNGIFYTNNKLLVESNDRKNIESGLNVAFIGGLSVAKGSKTAYQMIKDKKQDVNWFIFGGIADEKLQDLEQKNLVKTGWYDRENIGHLMEKYKIDLVCILPIWPETYCYTLSEALSAGVPVLATDIGAVGERMKEMDCGWLLPKESSYKDINRQIGMIFKDKSILEKKKNITKKIFLRSVDDMLEEYKKLYVLFRKKNDDREMDAEFIYRGYLLKDTKALLNFGYEETLQEKNYELDQIKNSTTYKLLIRISKIKIPFRNQVKNVLLKLFRRMRRLGIVK